MNVFSISDIIIGILLPFIGTSLGAATVFFIVKSSKTLHGALLGFASGVMLAASVWSLLLPAISMSEGALPAVSGFVVGALFLAVLNEITPLIRTDSGSKQKMMILAVTLHNLPEGMAVGVVYAGLMNGEGITVGEALALSLGIALQNLPEGAIISAPLASGGVKKLPAFACGVLSGLVEPFGAVLTLLLTGIITPILPYILAFAAGAMIYVTVSELIPECIGDDGRVGAASVSVGFVLMMFLDIV